MLENIFTKQRKEKVEAREEKEAPRGSLMQPKESEKEGTNYSNVNSLDYL